MNIWVASEWSPVISIKKEIQNKSIDKWINE